MLSRRIISISLALCAPALIFLTAPSALARTRGGPLPFAGYLAALSAETATAAADFTVPALRCPSSGISAVAPGVSLGNDYFEQSGAVVASCDAGTASYEAIIVLGNSNFSEFAVSAGDKMAASVASSPSGSGYAIKVMIRDLTHPASKSDTCTPKPPANGCGSITQAWFGDEPTHNSQTGTVNPIPRFTASTFTDCLVDGAALGSAKPTAYDLKTQNGTVVQIAPSAISGHTRFHDTFKHS